MAQRMVLPLSLITMLILGVLFWMYPQLDIDFSRRFIQDSGHFISIHQPFLNAFHHLMQVILPLVSSGLIVTAIAAVWNQWLKARMPSKASFYLLLCILIGPGLVVNATMKGQWGRPRPYHTTVFGGHAQFQPAWVKSDQCQRNCSFVCGDASVGFVGFALLPLVAARRRRQVIWGSITLGGCIGLTRIMVGAHFLSDVIFSGFLTYFSCACVASLMGYRSFCRQID